MNKGVYEGKVSAKRVDPNVIMNPDAQEEESLQQEVEQKVDRSSQGGAFTR